MKRVLLAVLMSATALAQSPSPSSYQVSDITLYGMQERHAIFYGSPGTLRQGANTLSLTRASGAATGLNVLGSLRVNNQTSLRLPVDQLGAAIVVRTARSALDLSSCSERRVLLRRLEMVHAEWSQRRFSEPVGHPSTSS
ncbi:MAG: hypothetical protein HC933_14510 [Pleurocapsa sp. SU_196_0]|nr:hypothetical protein [Pleurocapsa sp. SU_196_0]